MLFILCSSLSAQSIFTSLVDGGDWTNSASWSEDNQGNANDPNGVPDGNDNVIISGGMTININTATGQNVEDLTITTGTLTFLVAGDLDVEGTLTMTGVSNILASGVEGRIDHQGATMTISASATATIGAIRFDSNGVLNIDGSLAFSDVTGAKIFTDINLGSSGTWDNTAVAEDFLIDGDIDVALGGTWSGCSNTTDCTYTMRGSTSTITGTGVFAVPDITVGAGDVCTNEGNIVLTDNLSGATGTFINGDGGTLTLTENGNYNIGTLTLDTPGNTVIYAGTVNDVILPGPLHDVEVNMDVSTTIVQVNGSNAQIDGDLTITQGVFRIQTANTLTVGGDVIIEANGEFEPNVAGAIAEIAGNISLTDGAYDQNNGTVTVDGNFTVNSGSVTMDNSLSVLNVGTYIVSGGTNDLSTGTFAPATLTVDAGQAINIGSINLTSSGTTTVNGTMIIDGGTGDKTFNDLSLAGSGAISFSSNETLTVGGILSMSGTSSISGGNTNRIVDVTGTFIVPSGTATISDVSVSVAGLTTVSGNLEVTSTTGTKTFGDLTLNSSGNINLTANETLSIGGNLEMLGTSSITGTSTNQVIDVTGTFDVTSGTASIGGVRFTIAGATTIDGTLAFTSTTGVKTFADVVLGPTGTWDNSTVTEVFTFTGDLTNNGGTWNGCANTTGCAYTMTANPSGTISGSGIFNITDLVINAGTTITNTGNVVMTDNITGTGAFINGDQGVLTLSENGAYTITTLTLDTPENTVVYDGTVSDVLLPGPFYDLQVNMDVATTIIQVNGGNVQVDNDLTVTSGRFRIQTANTLTVGGNVIIDTNGEFEPNVAGATATITGNVEMTGGLYDQNEGTVTVGGNFTNNGGTLTVDGAASILAITGNYITSGGTTTNNINTVTLSFVDMAVNTGATVNVGNTDITSTGTITVDNGVFTIDGAGGSYNFADVTVNANGSWIATAAYDPTFTNATITNNGIFTGCSNTTGCSYALEGTGGFAGSAAMTSMSDFVLGDGATYTNTNSGGLAITDRLATVGTATFINGANGVMSYGGTSGNFSVTNFTASASPNTVIYNRTTSNQAIRETTDGAYHNLTIDKAIGFNVSTTTEVTVNGMLTMTLGDLIMGGQNLIMADGATIAGGNADSYIQDNGNGVLRQLYAAAGATLNFPIGDDDDFSPINSFTISSATFGASPFLDFSITDADHPNRDTDNTGAGGDDDGTATTAFISRYWTVSPNDISSPRYNASYTYVDGDVTGTETNLMGTIYRTPPGEAFADWHVGGTVNNSTNRVSISNIDAFGDLYAMDNILNRLPIVLVSFDIKATESTVEIAWVTASEENNDLFTIERSVDGREFLPIITVAGADNSQDLITYNTVDRSPLNGRSYYRLKQTDFNGQFEYSEIRSVMFNGPEVDLDFNIYPNPTEAGESFSFSVPDKLDVASLSWIISDVQGKPLKLPYQMEGNEVKVFTSFLKTGIYLIRVSNGKRFMTKKLIIR